MNDRDTFITMVGLEKLKKELHELKNVKRAQIAERIQSAKELGDLSENAEYVEAKNEQGFVEGRIMEIETIIRNATIIQKSKGSDGIVRVGSRIRIKDHSGEREYVIVGSNEADPAQGIISNESPLGQAFLGKKKGDIVQIDLPKGTTKIEILAIVS
ncbi:MAG: transcription elongation factor GreA [Candidatus Kerfeldbacteria bacterium]|nr:transcription elongation factor GreA [Candidatus Kerfeldbacteria bacterium]